MTNGNIDYGRLATKLAGDAGRYTRKAFDGVKGLVTGDGMASARDALKTTGATLHDLAGAVHRGWESEAEENSDTLDAAGTDKDSSNSESQG